MLVPLRMTTTVFMLKNKGCQQYIYMYCTTKQNFFLYETDRKISFKICLLYFHIKLKSNKTEKAI